MERVYKIISVILHPIVIPTISVLLYFIFISNNNTSKTKLALLSLIFVTTYLIPLLIIILFRKLNLIQSFSANSIEERKLPVALMIILCYLLANTIAHINDMKDISLLFYATSAALTLLYICLAFRLKTSPHLLSVGISTGFFIVLSIIHSNNFAIVVMIHMILAGLLANARLYVTGNTPNGVYLGFFLGFMSPFGVFYFL
jgi:hypothetical protein